jgi:hypothetical protein
MNTNTLEKLLEYIDARIEERRSRSPWTAYLREKAEMELRSLVLEEEEAE